MYGMDTNNVKKTKYYSEKAEQGKRYVRILLVLFLSLFLLCSCESTEPVVLPTETVPIGTQAGNLLGSNQNTATEQDEKLEVHFIDVGQGDAILIRFGEHAMQVDFGNNDKGTLVQSYLEKQGITSLDYAIGTHPDADHIGGMDVILYKWDVDTIFMPNKASDTATYRDVLQVCKNKNYKIEVPKAGAEYSLGDASFQIICPIADGYGDTNSYSIGIRLTYQDTSFVLCGDATKESETEMLCSNEPLSADVLKVSHHGSNTSTSEEFLKAVNPSYAVISCGKDNSYGHPHQETMELLEQYQVQIFRTDEQGSIVAVSDGKEIQWNTVEWSEDEPLNGYIYVLNTATKKYHYIWCSMVEDIKEENKEDTTKSKKELKKEGYEPCKRCVGE